jgi:large subunit ribosomal protein L4
MIDIPVYSVDGNETGKVQVDPALLGGEVRPALLKQAFVAGHANRHQGTAANRGRGAKEGSGRKLFRQKGTGRARRGEVRTNVLRGGGVAFPKSAKKTRATLPAKMRRLANRNALLSKIADGELKVIDRFDFAEPGTKRFAAILAALSIDRSCLFAVDPDDKNAILSARNVPDCDLIRPDQLNTYDLLTHRFVLIDQPTLQRYLDGLKPLGHGGEAPAEQKEAA